MNTLPAKQEKTMKQIALKSFMQNNPFKTFRIHEYWMSYLFPFRIPYKTVFT